MYTRLFIGTKKVKFFVDLGWYSGSQFALFKLSFFDNYMEDGWTIFDIQVFKIIFSLGFDLFEED